LTQRLRRSNPENNSCLNVVQNPPPANRFYRHFFNAHRTWQAQLIGSARDRHYRARRSGARTQYMTLLVIEVQRAEASLLISLH
jgi:hypothetical protein